MDKKTKTELVLTSHEQLLVRCYHKKVITFGGLTDRLEKRGEGTFKVDKNRSAIFLDRTKNFPKNSEFDVMLTFSGNPTGKLLQTVTPSPKSVTVHQHHSFVKLPDKNYTPRKFDPRSGANGFHFFDYSTPVNESTKKTYVVRHRLKKKDPSESISEAVEPIIYYLEILLSPKEQQDMQKS